jgi:hypothetical protein
MLQDAGDTILHSSMASARPTSVKTALLSWVGCLTRKFDKAEAVFAAADFGNNSHSQASSFPDLENVSMYLAVAGRRPVRLADRNVAPLRACRPLCIVGSLI